MDIILLFRYTVCKKTKWGFALCSSGSHQHTGECGESHLQEFAQPQEAGGSPEVSLPEITHWATSPGGGRGVHSEPAYFHISESSESKGA